MYLASRVIVNDFHELARTHTQKKAACAGGLCISQIS